MRRYLRPEMEEEFGKDLYEALDMLETVHANVWCAFDPAGNRGDEDQPADVKVALQEIQELFERHGLCIEGFEHEDEEVE